MANSETTTPAIFKNLKPAMSSPPKDLRVETGFFNVADGTDIFWRVWEADKPKGLVVLVHGFMEHSARYHHVASALVRSGFAVFSYDCRGHGRSGGKRGFIRSFSEHASDLESVVSKARDRFADLPLHILGHSNGGLISIHHASHSKQSSEVNSYAFTSPFVGMKEVPPAKAFAGNILSSILPALALPTGVDAKWISRRTEVVDDYKNDPMIFDKATSRWYTETKSTQENLKKEVQNISQPTLWIIALADEVADAPSAQRLSKKVKSEKKIDLLPDHYHEVLNELDWEVHAQKIIDWFGEHQ